MKPGEIFHFDNVVANIIFTLKKRERERERERKEKRIGDKIFQSPTEVETVYS